MTRAVNTKLNNREIFLAFLQQFTDRSIYNDLNVVPSTNKFMRQIQIHTFRAATAEIGENDRYQEFRGNTTH